MKDHKHIDKGYMNLKLNPFEENKNLFSVYDSFLEVIFGRLRLNLCEALGDFFFYGAITIYPLLDNP